MAALAAADYPDYAAYINAANTAGFLDHPRQAGTIRQGHFILIYDRPCEVQTVLKRLPHWRTFVCRDIFDWTEHVSPEYALNAQVEIPHVHKSDYRVIDLQGSHIQVMNMVEYKDFVVTDRILLAKIRTRLTEDRRSHSPLAGTVLSSMGQVQLCGFKTISPIYYHDWDLE